jgi:hypothetical protein
MRARGFASASRVATQARGGGGGLGVCGCFSALWFAFKTEKRVHKQSNTVYEKALQWFVTVCLFVHPLPVMTKTLGQGQKLGTKPHNRNLVLMFFACPP